MILQVWTKGEPMVIEAVTEFTVEGEKGYSIESAEINGRQVARFVGLGTLEEEEKKLYDEVEDDDVLL